MHKTLEANCCFGLVDKVVAEVQRRSFFFGSLTWVHNMYKKTRSSFWISNLSTFFMNPLLSFHVIFVLLCFLIISSSLCYGEIKELHA